MIALVKIILLVILFQTDACALKLPVIFDSSNVLHKSINYHPEQPARIQACVEKLQKIDEIKLIDVAPEDSLLKNSDQIARENFSEAQLQHAKEILLKTHSPDLIENLEASCFEARKRRIEEGREPLGFMGNIDEDTYVTTETFNVCLRATASWIRAAEEAMNNANFSKAAMALTRPPGHHATFEMANGFCLMNFAAATAVHLLTKYPDLKVSIFDWDVHYGQGVAAIIRNHDRVRYASIHQSPAFPYIGDRLSISGEFSNIMTVPISADTTWSLGYRQKLEEHVLPFLVSDDWHPDIVLVCAGYDALDSDELASVALVARDYGNIAQMLKKELKVKTGTAVPIALGLEGGYQLGEMAGGGNLGDAVVSSLKAFLQ